MPVGDPCALAECQEIVKPPNRKYCCAAHSHKSGRRRYMARQAAIRQGDLETARKLSTRKHPPRQKRTGQNYKDLIANPDILERLDRKLITHKAAALELGARTGRIFTQENLTYSYNSIQTDRAGLDLETGRFVPSPDNLALLELENFADFRRTFFENEDGQPFETRDFHQDWMNAIADTIESGSDVLILSPPRAGKTEMLIHTVIREIVKNPNIRIAWVGGNEDIAKKALKSVREHLEDNEKLIMAYCGKNGKFRPDNRSSHPWSATELEVATRTIVGRKSPTLTALGKGGKTLSRDMDIIVLDDIEDHMTTMQPQQRENTRNWWTTQLQSRVEGHTAVVMIGSRQHPDDLYNYVLENPDVSKIVEEAHSSDCEEDPYDEDAHYECMLWPNRHDYKWLMRQFRNAEHGAGRAVAEMVYLNRPMESGLMMFDPKKVDASKDETRIIGDRKPGWYLCGGLDPSAAGFQAAFLWGFDIPNVTQYMVDLENHKGGGIPDARRIIQEWFERYECRHWAIEDNMYQGGIHKDELLTRFCQDKGITLEAHNTQGTNKWHPQLGVTGMAPQFPDQINLPYGDPESVSKVDLYKKQLVQFSTAATQARSNRMRFQSDIVMASWFPRKVWLRLLKQHSPVVRMSYNASFANYGPTLSGVPWGRSNR